MDTDIDVEVTSKKLSIGTERKLHNKELVMCEGLSVTKEGCMFQFKVL